MLVLTRRVGEQVVVPQCQLSVTVLEVLPNRVRLGISAPKDVAVHRREVEDRICAAANPAEGGSSPSVRILIADPDSRLLAYYGEHLSKRYANVATASTALECLEEIRLSVPDVLVLDPELLWGGGDGLLAVLDQQPAMRPRLVTVLTRGGCRGLLYRLSSFKVDDYQVKPMTAAQLADWIGRLVAGKAA